MASCRIEEWPAGKWGEAGTSGWPLPAGRVVEVLENAFLRHGSPRHIITDQEGVFVSDLLGQLLR